MNEMDFTVDNHGSIFLLFAHTEAAQEWLDDNLMPDDVTTWGVNGTVIEHRYISALVEGILNDGLTVSVGCT